MEALEAAKASGDSIGGLGAHFMLDMNTYAHGATLGFEQIDFYVAGRCGVLGEVPAQVATAALMFFEPDYIAQAWERSAVVMPRLEAGRLFAEVAHSWAEEKLSDDLDLGRLAELAGRVADAASPAAAPLFAGWRALAEPDPDRPKALALHRINALRELRGAMHGAAVLTQGISPHAAVALRTPFMLDVFGWKAPHPDTALVKPLWHEAQAATERALSPAFEALSSSEREELVELVNATQAHVLGQ